MAVTNFREDTLGRDLQNPGTNALDFLRAVISTCVRLEQRIMARPVAVRADLLSQTYGQLLPRDTAQERAEMARLRAEEEEARRVMDAAGNALVDARQAERLAQWHDSFTAAHSGA